MSEDFEINGKHFKVNLNSLSDGSMSVKINEKTVDLEHLSVLEDKRVAIIKNGKPYEIILSGDCVEDFDFSIKGIGIIAKINDDKDIKKLRSGGGSSFGGKVVSSVMPGKVVKIFTKVGQEVKKGEALLIVEAMKMENEIKSPADGIVKRIDAVEGTTVEANKPLVIID